MRPADSGKRTHAAKARGRMGCACALWFGLAWPLAAAANASIQDLGNIVVISVAKTPEPLSNASASMYVITIHAPKVLLVQDEPFLRELAAKRLTEAGYAQGLPPSLEHAVHRVLQKPFPIDLLPQAVAAAMGDGAAAAPA